MNISEKNKGEITTFKPIKSVKRSKKEYTNTRRYLIIIIIHLFLLVSYIVWKNIDMFFPELGEKVITAKRDYEELYITYSQDAISLDSGSLENVNRVRLNHIYEGLVEYDENFNLKPSLSLAWGKIDNLTWEFHLRQGVVFHNGDTFDADDVIETFHWALNRKDSQVATLLENIESMDKIEDYKIRIITKNIDPLLLSKLTSFYVLSADSLAEDVNRIIEHPNGTGPYQFLEWKKGEYLKLAAFKKYYRGTPLFKNLIIKVLPNKHARMASVKDKTTDILADVPPVYLVQLSTKYNYEIKNVSSLESIFLLFNFNNEYLKDREIRKAIKKLINYEKLYRFVGEYGVILNQFVSSGVFGYSPDIKPLTTDVAKSLDVIKTKTKDKGFEATLALIKENENLGAIIKEEFAGANINIELVILTPEELSENLLQKNSDMYLLGWKFGSGDVSEFYDYFIRSSGSYKDNNHDRRGRFNLHYKNDEVDVLIEKAASEMTERERLKSLQKIMKIITEEDIIGIPLFESDKIYATSPDLQFTPRMDGLITVR